MKPSRLPFAAALRAATKTVDGVMWTYTVSDGKDFIGGGYTSDASAWWKCTPGAIKVDMSFYAD